MNYLLARLSEPSTYRGLFALLTALGIVIEPDRAAAITAAGLALIGLVNVFKKDAKSTALILASFLLLPSCATNPLGEKTFLSLTKDDWAIIGKEAAITGAKTAASSAFLSYTERRNIEVTATK